MWTPQGFGARIVPSGSKVHIRANGKSRRLTVGRHGLISAEQARHKAAQVIGDINAGTKPMLDNGTSSAGAAPTLADVAE